MVYKLVLERRFYWERLIQKFLIEVLLFFMYENTGYTLLIELRTTCTTYHLEQVCQGEVHVAADLRVEELSAFDDNQSCREVNTPSKC